MRFNHYTPLPNGVPSDRVLHNDLCPNSNAMPPLVGSYEPSLDSMPRQSHGIVYYQGNIVLFVVRFVKKFVTL